MKTVQCPHCKHLVNWNADRGRRLCDTPCPFCAQPLAKRVVATPTKGKRFGACVVCGRKRLEGDPCWYHSKEAVAAALTRSSTEGGAD